MRHPHGGFLAGRQVARFGGAIVGDGDQRCFGVTIGGQRGCAIRGEHLFEINGLGDAGEGEEGQQQEQQYQTAIPLLWHLAVTIAPHPDL